MTKQTDSKAITGLIIEMAKTNDWISRNELEKKIKKPQKTIISYLEKDKNISNLIEKDNHSFFVSVKRRTGSAETVIIKYRLKPGLDNLAAIFNFLNDRNLIKELMNTPFYVGLIPEIKSKFEAGLPQNHINKQCSLFICLVIKNSPSATRFIINNKVTQNNDLKDYFNKLPLNLKRTAKNPNVLLIMIVQGLLFTDIAEGIIDSDALNQRVDEVLKGQ